MYEDENVLFINKPVGMLSQKADKNDCSLVEYITAYLLHNNSLTYEDLAMFTPSICNRLDRNTSGIIAAGKTMKGLQELSSHFKERTLTKYYICIVAGKVDKRQLIKGYLYKDKSLTKLQYARHCQRAGLQVNIFQSKRNISLLHILIMPRF